MSYTCKTCGGQDGSHVPSMLDPKGVGHSNHSVQASDTSVGNPTPLNQDELGELDEIEFKESIYEYLLWKFVAWHRSNGKDINPTLLDDLIKSNVTVITNEINKRHSEYVDRERQQARIDELENVRHPSHADGRWDDWREARLASLKEKK